MTLDLRVLLSRYNVNWRDRGKNCAREHVNICCPFCGNADTGYHLGISEIGEGYYCLRNPKHAGVNLNYLFKALKIPYQPGMKFSAPIKQTQEQTEQKDYTEFRYFLPAEDSQEVLDYLESRLFLDPVGTCKKFNLKFADVGKWAGRLIIPLTTGWTGRTMRSHIEPRYLSHTDETGFFHHGRSSSLILVEGPLDAMRIASISSSFAVKAQLGQRISDTIAMKFREENYSTIYYLPDKDVSFSLYYETTKLIRSYCTRTDVIRINLPDGKKDAGELNESEAREWLLNVTKVQTEVF